MSKKHTEIIKKNQEEAKKYMSHEQLKNCHIAIHSAATIAASAGAIPVPVADAVPISATQVTMVFALGKIFNQKIGESSAKAIVSAAASTLVGRSLIKLIPVVGWGISAAVAASVTEAVGWMTAVDFAKKFANEWSQNNSSDEPVEDVECDFDKDNEEKINSLIAQAQLFLNGEKDYESNKDEFNTLTLEIAGILGDLSENSPLHKIHRDLLNLALK